MRGGARGTSAPAPGGAQADAAVPSHAQKRARVVWIAALIGLLACAAQLFNIQIVRGAELAEQGRTVRTSVSRIDAPRGSIVDATGQVLVDTVKTYHIAVNQKNITEYIRRDKKGNVVGRGPAEAAKQLAPLLDRDPAELGGQMLGDSPYVYLAKDVDATTYRAIRKLGIYGIEWEPSFERLYPAGSTAASVVGSVDYEGQGNSGLELTFNDILQGVPGEASYEIGPTGAVMPGAKVTTKEAQPGATLHTSIHSDLQHSVEEALNETVETWGAEWGAVVVLDVATSRVLVLADSGLKDPSNGPQSSAAVQMVYEPGSVGKALTFATALEHGTITPYTEFTVPDRYEAGGQIFTDMHPHETYVRTSTGILAASLNTGTVMVSETVSDEQRFETFQKFGLGAPTGIELPGESAGILHPYEEWDGRMRYTTSFGQGYAVTAIQAAQLMATIANGGVWNAPRLVDGWTTADGVYHEAEREAPHEALRPEVAETLSLMLESVTSDPGLGTGRAAAVDGYRVAAKTGTAELLGLGIVPSMAGFLPADDPQIAICAVLYKPAVEETAAVAVAPLFSRVSAEAIRSLGIAPSGEAARLFPSEPVAAE